MARTGRPVAAGWVRASACGHNGNCVEVARAVLGGAEVVVVRRSGVPQQDVLVFTLEEWAAFLAGVRAGEFDPQALGVMPGGGEDGSPPPSEVPVGEIRPPQVSR